jgi:hypothetical protein
MKHARYPVSHWAVLRYLELVYGIDIKATRQEISALVDQASEDVIEDLGEPAVVRHKSNSYLLRDGVVTSVEPSHLPNHRLGRKIWTND